MEREIDIDGTKVTVHNTYDILTTNRLASAIENAFSPDNYAFDVYATKEELEKQSLAIEIREEQLGFALAALDDIQSLCRDNRTSNKPELVKAIAGVLNIIDNSMVEL